MWNVRLTSPMWHTFSSVKVCGYAYDRNNVLMEGAALCAYFDVDNIETFSDRLKTCNGLFSVVCCSEKFCAAAVDPSRIYPLYYRRQDDGELILSDDPNRLLHKGDVLWEESVSEYHVAGYPLTGKTLVKGILQVKPAYFLYGDGEQTLYYSYIAFQQELEMPTIAEMQDVIERVFLRMLDSLNGRQVVVPLSGGNDSRLILCMLRRLRYENVICYTVGRPGNAEELVATKVAQELGYPLYIVDTTQEELANYVCLDDEEFQQYYQFIGGFSNFVWLFEYAAIKWLRSRRLLLENAVFVPGHAADFNAGSHMRRSCVGMRNSAFYLANAIAIDNFEYGFDKKVWNKLHRYFADCSKNKDVVSWSIFQSFVLQNRLPYNINNSARVYPFFGYDVRLPYWDKEFLELFRVMPYKGLKGCSKYVDFIRERIFIPMNVDFSGRDIPNSYFYKMKILRRIKWLIPAFIRNRMNKADLLGELLLSKSMLRELIQHKQYGEYDKCSANQIMKDWYLLRVKQQIENA